jgi:sugar lactone lactonase YvrE
MLDGKKVDASPGGIAFDAKGDLYLAAGAFSEVVRIKAADLNPGKPGLAQTFATGVPGANGIAFDSRGTLYVSGGASGIVYSVGPNGGAAQSSAQIDRNTRTLPDGKTTQAIVANGLKFDSAGVLHVADTSRGAVWKVVMGADGKGGKPVLLAQSPLLEGADDMAFLSNGDVWVAANELNAIVSVSPMGVVKTVAKNGSQGPLEFPAALVFVGKTAYIANFDVPRRDNMDANGSTAKDGIGASIAQITP